MVLKFLSGERRRLSPDAVVLLFAGFFCVLLVGIDGWRTWQTRQLVIAQDYSDTANLAKSLTQHARDTVDSADTILVGLRDIVEHEGEGAEQNTRLQSLIVDLMTPLPALHGLLVFDAAGDLVVSSLPLRRGAINGVENDYFQYHRAHADRSLHLAGLLRCVTNCTWVFALSRRIDRPDGSFGGVAMVSISVDVLKRFYSTFEKGPHGSIGLLSKDGIIVAREPDATAPTGSDVSRGEIFRTLLRQSSVGSFDEVFPIDQVRRLGSYRVVDGLPLLVVVGHGFDDVLTAWRADAALHTGVDILASALVLFVGRRFARQIKARQRAEAKIAALNIQLAAQASTDSLTDLFNRRRFDEALESEWIRAVEGRLSISLLFIDVDRFKRFNDRYGHLRGDWCLRTLSTTIMGASRAGDLVARYGGEEIAVLLSDTDEAGAHEVAERIRVAIEQLKIPHVDNVPFRVVTASIGIATLVPVGHSMTAETLISTADTALYDAKRTGRNRVVGWRDEGLAAFA